MNRIDPNGETDIYIGGAGDSQTRIVRNYAAVQASVGDRTVGYFNHGDKAGVVAFAKGRGDAIEAVDKALGAVTTLGGGTPSAFRAENTDVNIVATTNHADFAGAFTAAGKDGLSAKDIVDDSYKDKQ